MASTPLFELSLPNCGNWCGMLIFCTRIWVHLGGDVFVWPFPSQPMWIFIITGVVVKTSPSQNFDLPPNSLKCRQPYGGVLKHSMGACNH